MLEEYTRELRRRVHEADAALWRSVRTREDWEAARDARLVALAGSLSLGSLPGAASWPPAGEKAVDAEDWQGRVVDGDPVRSLAQAAARAAGGEAIVLDARATSSIGGDGFRIDCLTYESGPGIRITANLYSPDVPRSGTPTSITPAAVAPAAGVPPPAMIILHSHHNPKTQGELQDMGMLWARQGCLVLVPDLLGHGERRQHPFRTAVDFDGKFVVGLGFGRTVALHHHSSSFDTTY
jgi:hypothetical protein